MNKAIGDNTYPIFIWRGLGNLLDKKISVQVDWTVWQSVANPLVLVDGILRVISEEWSAKN